MRMVQFNAFGDCRMWKGRISIRFMLLGLAVVAILLAIATRQQRIAFGLRQMDAQITYRYQYNHWEDPNHYSLDNDATLSPIGQRLGADLTSTIVTVRSSKASNPARIAQLASQLPHLRTLSILDSALNDRDLRHLTGLTELRGLHLCGTAITDESVDTLSRISQLVVLNVQDTRLSDSAIRSLKRALPNTRVHTGIRQGGYM